MNHLQSIVLASVIAVFAIAGVVTFWVERKLRTSKRTEQTATDGPPFEWLQQ